MSISIHHADLIAALSALSGPEDVKSSDGRVLGKFIPAAKAMNFPEFGKTDEELEREENDPSNVWLTVEQVEERLRSLRKDA
jgi:hypothetical protein